MSLLLIAMALGVCSFLVNVECLEGQFDTWGAFGFGFHNNLSMVRHTHTHPPLSPSPSPSPALILALAFMRLASYVSSDTCQAGLDSTQGQLRLSSLHDLVLAW